MLETIFTTLVPVAFVVLFTTMFAEEYGVLSSESSTTILATRVLSFATIPAVFALTQRL
jgi:hypothetical protein